MTETTAPEEDHNPLTPETFSFFDVFEGLEHPTDTVTIFMNEKAQYDLNKKLNEIGRTAEGDGKLDELAAAAAKLHDKVEASRHTFDITGVDDDTITDLRDVAEAAFEDRKKQIKRADGTLIKQLPESEQLAYARYFNALVMSVHITRVEDARGRVMVAPGVDEVAILLDKAPTSQKAKLQSAINDLRVRATDFESSVDADFLAKP